MVSIYSHTHTHSKLTSLSEVKIDFELLESKKIIENIINKQIDSICFPQGIFNKKEYSYFFNYYKLIYITVVVQYK